MANVTVIGSQWGDEGKGKIVDWLASRADAVVRFQGGHNAGHTLVVGEQVNASSGIGYLMMNAREFVRTDIIFVGLVVYAILGLSADIIVRRIEGSLLSWRTSFLKD